MTGQPRAIIGWALVGTAICFAPLSAEIEELENGAEEASSTSAIATPKQPAAVQRATVLVEASLPYIPTSNTIATKLPVELSWTPANVGVVSGLLMEEQNALILSDALENVSGVNVQTGFGLFDFFVIRGFDSLSSSLVLTDGAPEPEVTFYQLYNAERVEVFKGPAGFLYGPNPLAGAVNIVRKQPIPSRFAVVGATVGNYESFEGTLDANLANASGDLAFRLNGLWRESDGYRDGRDSQVGAVNPSLTWRPDDKSTLNLNLESVSSDFTPDAGLPVVGAGIPDVPRERSYASPFDFSEQDIHRIQIDYQRSISDRLTLRNKTYYRELDWLTDGTFFGFVLPTPDGGLALTRTLLDLDDRQEFLGNQLEAILSARTGGVTHRILAGLELERLEDTFTLDAFLLPPLDIFDPVETATKPLFPIPGQFSAGDTRSDIIAPYVIDQMTFSDRFQILVGVRYDDIDFEDQVSGSKRSDGKASPLLGAVYSPVDRLFLYANTARSIAPPSPRVTGEAVPEESRQLELGARKEFLDGRLRATVALFELERENIAIPDDNGFTQQVGDQTARGLELELAGQITSTLRGFLAYAYTDSELTRFTEQVLVGFAPPTFVTLDRSGNTSAFSPEHLLNLWLSKRVSKGWGVSAGVRYVDDQFISEDNLTTIDSHLLLDAAVTWSRGDWRWHLNLSNLTDEEYETRGFGGVSVIPAQPASAAVGLEYRF